MLDRLRRFDRCRQKIDYLSPPPAATREASLYSLCRTSPAPALLPLGDDFAPAAYAEDLLYRGPAWPLYHKVSRRESRMRSAPRHERGFKRARLIAIAPSRRGRYCLYISAEVSLYAPLRDASSWRCAALLRHATCRRPGRAVEFSGFPFDSYRADTIDDELPLIGGRSIFADDERVV